MESGIAQMMSLAKTLRAHATGILNYFHHPISTGKLEGIKDVFKLNGFDHQHGYLFEIAQHTALYAIGKMVQDIKLKEDGTCAAS